MAVDSNLDYSGVLPPAKTAITELPRGAGKTALINEALKHIGAEDPPTISTRATELMKRWHELYNGITPL